MVKKISNGVKILAIETSCDDTGIAVLEINLKGQTKLLANLVSSQIKIHAPWGGVVPTLAKREHQRNLVPLLIKALNKSKLLKNHKSQIPKPKQITNPKTQTKKIEFILSREETLAQQLIPFLQKYQKPDIDYIAVTVGPGLEPALWVGVNFARALSYIWDIPIIPINHIEGHMTACWLKPTGGMTNDQFPITNKILPALALIVSGGHTQLILIKKFGQYEIIGETRDDAAGEAFDKVAKMLNLGYPGGPAISAVANKHKNAHEFSRMTIRDISDKFVQISDIALPRPMLHSPDFDFSFSGLKTAALYLVKKLTPAQIKKLTPAIAAEFQQAVIDVLVAKTIKAARHYNVETIMLGGGVAANEALRQNLKLQITNHKLQLLMPNKKMCADNAAMIAFVAAQQLIANKKSKTVAWQKLQAQANLRI